MIPAKYKNGLCSGLSYAFAAKFKQIPPAADTSFIGMIYKIDVFICFYLTYFITSVII